MKSLISVYAHIYNADGKIVCHEKQYRFIRSRMFKPTYVGAARMIAKETGVKPSDISVTRIESASFAS